MKVVLVTGSRRLRLEGKTLMFNMLNSFRPDMVIHGKCPTGADLYAHHWCNITHTFEVPMPAKWATFGRGAGPERNRGMSTIAQIMKNYGHEVVCYAFPQDHSYGTWNCMSQCERRGIPVYENGKLVVDE